MEGNPIRSGEIGPTEHPWSVHMGSFHPDMIPAAVNVMEEARANLPAYQKNMPESSQDRYVILETLPKLFAILAPEIANEKEIEEEINLAAETAIQYTVNLDDTQLMRELKLKAADILPKETPLYVLADELYSKGMVSGNIRRTLEALLRVFAIMENGDPLPQPRRTR